MIFTKFEQGGMGSGMFQWFNRLRVWNLSLIYKIMKICEKKFGTLSTGNLSIADTLPDFGPKKEFPVLKVPNFFSQIFIIL